MSKSVSPVLPCVFSLPEGTSGSGHRNMSSSAGGLGLEKNVLTQSGNGTYFSSCESKFPPVVRNWEAVVFRFGPSLENFVTFYGQKKRKKNQIKSHVESEETLNACTRED